MSEHSTTTASPTRTEAELRTLMARAVREVRETNPLAPSITNTVTQSFVANAQLAVGGSAAMVYLPDEGECVAALGGAVYINLGTLMPVYEQTVPATARACAAAATPWVLDPVGVGIGSLRTRLIEAVRENPPTILRGNASEIIAVADLWGLGGGSGMFGHGGSFPEAGALSCGPRQKRRSPQEAPLVLGEHAPYDSVS